MKKLTAIILALTLLLSFAGCISQEDVDNAVSDATKPLNEQIAQLNKEIADKAAKIKTLEDEKTALTAEKAELEGEIDEVDAEITTLNAKVAELEAGGEADDAEIAKLKGDISDLEEKKTALTDEKAALEASISAKETEITNLNSSIETLTEEKQALADKVAALEKENETLESEKSELEKENETLKNCVKGNHSGTLSYTANNDGTQHTATYSCCGTTVTEDHSENTTIGQTCLGYKCVVCGAWYGDTDATNHASDEFTYTANADGTTHTKAYPCCGTVVDAGEAHTMDTTTGKCVCGLQMAEVSITRGNTVTYYEDLSVVLKLNTTIPQSGDTVTLCKNVNITENVYGGYLDIPYGVTFDGGEYTLIISLGGIYNNGTITGGTFNDSVSNFGTITGGTFNGSVSNFGTITGGTFNKDVYLDGGTITGGIFNEEIYVDGSYEECKISGAITLGASSPQIYIRDVGDISIDLTEAVVEDYSRIYVYNETGADLTISSIITLPENLCPLEYNYDEGKDVYVDTIPADGFVRIMEHTHEFDTTTGMCECGATSGTSAE